MCISKIQFFMIINLTVGHSDKDIFTKIYSGKEGFNACTLKDFLRRQSLKKMSTKKGKMANGTKSRKICHSTQNLN